MSTEVFCMKALHRCALHNIVTHTFQFGILPSFLLEKMYPERSQAYAVGDDLSGGVRCHSSSLREMSAHFPGVYGCCARRCDYLKY